MTLHFSTDRHTEGIHYEPRPATKPGDSARFGVAGFTEAPHLTTHDDAVLHRPSLLREFPPSPRQPRLPATLPDPGSRGLPRPYS